ncbi:MAG: tetratricopeptide repeat protein [Lentisphaerae bacterium]|nr:tetratricopeptide repeat protein [Lentisphaerota bacterium]
MGEAAFQQGRYEEAEKALRRLLTDHPEPSVDSRMRLGVSLLRLGRHGPALDTLRLCFEERRRDPTLHFFLACAYANQAQTGRALVHLETACGPLAFPLLPFAGDPLLMSLRGEPRFRRLLHAALNAAVESGAPALEQ